MTRLTTPKIRRLVLVCCAVLVTVSLAVGPALGQTADGSAAIEDVTYSGNGSVSVPDAELVLWRSASHQFTVTVAAPTDTDTEVCLVVDQTGRGLGCERETVPGNATVSLGIDVGQWPTDATGEVTLDVVLRRPNQSTPIDVRSLNVTVLRTDGDPDDDGLASQREVSLGTNPLSQDTDGDGISDGLEVTTYDSSPLFADSDNDGLSDGVEIETYLTNPTRADTDRDGLLDSRERELGSSPFSRDSDGDGLSDTVEVNTYGTNATVADTDADGLDDGTELNTHQTNPRKGDTDGDGLSDALEVITYETEPGDPDTDDDGVLDGAEVNVHRTEPTTADTDSDGLDDGGEVHTAGTNPLNADTDGDGLSDGAEVDEYETNPLAVDTDGDGISDGEEVDIGTDSPGRGAGVVAVGVLLVLTAATAGFYWASGRVPGRRVVDSVRNRVRTTGRGLGRRGRRDESEEGQYGAPAHGSSVPDVDDDVPPEFLSNEKRVFRLLDEWDGPIRQSEIVEETGWSKAKVSRVLSKMETEGDITKLNVGRENLVTRPEDVPPGASPPFDS